MGESGSGKTTLLNILAALDKPTSGEVRLNGKDLSEIREKEISAFRRDNLGFVFQDFNLLDTFSLKDNIFLPLVLSGKSYQEMSRLLEAGASLPPALLADNDMIALGCSRALKDHGFRLPQDCSIVGIDDIPFSSICSPPLTSVQISCRELGAQAVRLLHYKLKNPGSPPAKILVDGRLIVRGSAAPFTGQAPERTP